MSRRDDVDRLSSGERALRERTRYLDAAVTAHRRGCALLAEYTRAGVFVGWIEVPA